MFKGRRLRTALTLTALTATTKAGDLTGPAPTQARNVAGAWHGRAEDTYGNQQDVQVFLDHGGSQVTGTIQSQMFRTNELFPLSGTMSSSEMSKQPPRLAASTVARSVSSPARSFQRSPSGENIKP